MMVRPYHFAASRCSKKDDKHFSRAKGRELSESRVDKYPVKTINYEGLDNIKIKFISCNLLLNPYSLWYRETCVL
jgi:hypothetical protein